ncbi:hypothetical protein [Streptomyces sp. NPDC046685]|uniref:hypothetical protein n=1 Tax=Streptomyces sp. NPDC046685 TaxID=3157202 RepID=UPI0033DF7815
MIDLNRTYTHKRPPDYTDHVIRVKVGKRAMRRTGEPVVVVSGLVALLADQIDAIPDVSRKGNTIRVLDTYPLVLSYAEVPVWEAGDMRATMDGRVRTLYPGTPELPLAAVLELGELLHAQIDPDQVEDW